MLHHRKLTQLACVDARRKNAGLIIGKISEHSPELSELSRINRDAIGPAQTDRSWRQPDRRRAPMGRRARLARSKIRPRTGGARLTVEMMNAKDFTQPGECPQGLAGGRG
jgi:hypothetical protein